MTDKQKIADLEKRVKDLEARPQAPTIIVLPANPLPVIPYIQPAPYIPPYTVPYSPYQPWWTTTCGSASTNSDGILTFTPSPLHMQLGLS